MDHETRCLLAWFQRLLQSIYYCSSFFFVEIHNQKTFCCWLLCFSKISTIKLSSYLSNKLSIFCQRFPSFFIVLSMVSWNPLHGPTTYSHLYVTYQLFAPPSRILHCISSSPYWITLHWVEPLPNLSRLRKIGRNYQKPLSS